MIPYVITRELYTARCVEPGCVDHYGVGNILTDPSKGSVAQLHNR